ncbi:carboxy-S-adenosyl-L-methionine synthase CmoA [Desulfobulbus sp. F3]|nr:carboxy-S-adenosyl-L-methionine synthase CmoA [Desulfobulbus sp. F3]
MSSDSLYRSGEVTEDFSFNERVAEVFDDMLDRSVPFYRTVIKTAAALIRQITAPGSTVVDLGCSTGSTLLELARLLPDMHLRFIGLDNAPAMLDKARRKAEMFSKDIEFRQQDITSPDLGQQLAGTDVILCSYTMQFIRPLLRQDFVSRLHAALPAGGLLLVSEKIISSHSLLNRKFINIYYEFKREQGYSELEIAAKREALENVLIPFTVEENLSMLRHGGFSRAEIYFRWINFASFVAMKELTE